jgi:hypothetical protein
METNHGFRHKIMSGAEDQRAKRWHDKRMRKKGCNLGDKMLMNSSRYEISRTRKPSSKRKGPTWCHQAPMIKITF